jgi:hypothetical protein
MPLPMNPTQVGPTRRGLATFCGFMVLWRARLSERRRLTSRPNLEHPATVSLDASGRPHELFSHEACLRARGAREAVGVSLQLLLARVVIPASRILNGI